MCSGGSPPPRVILLVVWDFDDDALCREAVELDEEEEHSQQGGAEQGGRGEGVASARLALALALAQRRLAAPPPLRPCTSLPSSLLANYFRHNCDDGPHFEALVSRARRCVLVEQVALEPAPTALSASRGFSPILLKTVVTTF